MEFKAGSLVRARNRDWVVMPSSDEKLVLLKPLGGSEDEITAYYRGDNKYLPGSNPLTDLQRQVRIGDRHGQC